ncbi:Endonuclease 4 [bioreactor metagenome]|uniref:Endonuclease 4 n=1 Tax=bioreactor metagenome TaxID=1076179 RepID=A0A645HCK1_9ZZZZ
MKEALAATQQVHAVIENTAGQGTNLGFALEHLARLIELLDGSSRVGVCIDTCHTYAAGYDLGTPEGYERFWARFENLIGYERLEGMHLNDAKAGLNSHLDRHESLGAGTLGWDIFGRIAADPHLENIPLVLETPDEDLWATEIARLKELAKNTD